MLNINKLYQDNINFDTPNRYKLLKNGFNLNKNKNIIGSGSYGIVIKGTYKNKDVAVKIIANTNESKTRAVKNEYNILELEHKNITTTLKIESTKLHSIIIMETFPGHCLQYLIDNIQLPLHHRLNICLDIICGLNYCHSNGILHLDIKPKNILISYLNPDNENKTYICKLCDFGSSMNLNKLQEYSNSTGTVRYMAPEILKGRTTLSPACDIYSFGITMWQIKTRLNPYFQIDSHETVAYKVVKDNLRPNFSTTRNNENFNNKLDCFCEKFPSNCKILNNINPLKINQVNFPKNLLNPEIHNLKNNRSLFKSRNNQIVSKFEENPITNKALVYQHFCDKFIMSAKLIELEENYDKLFQCCWDVNTSIRPSGKFIHNKLIELL